MVGKEKEGGTTMTKPITKKELIDRFNHIPDDALILCIPVKNSPIPELVGAWMDDVDQVCISSVNDWAYVEPMTSDSIIRHFIRDKESQP